MQQQHTTKDVESNEDTKKRISIARENITRWSKMKRVASFGKHVAHVAHAHFTPPWSGDVSAKRVLKEKFTFNHNQIWIWNSLHLVKVLSNVPYEVGKNQCFPLLRPISLSDGVPSAGTPSIPLTTLCQTWKHKNNYHYKRDHDHGGTG